MGILAIIYNNMFEHIHHFQQLSSCGVGVDSTLHFGGVEYRATDVAESWMSDDMMSGGAAYSMSGSDQGAYNSYSSIYAYWSDTTAMDNIRAADITDSTVAGSLETIAANTTATNVRGGHSVHTATGHA